MAKIAKLAAGYIARHPVIMDCLQGDMVNYSKLARRISSELKIRNTAAITAACRRYGLSLRKGKQKETAVSALKKARKSIRIENQKAHITFTISEKSLPRVLETLK